MNAYNEYGTIEKLAIRSAEHAFVDQQRIKRDWRLLRYHSMPLLDDAIREYQEFVDAFQSIEADLIHIGPNDALTLDSIYTRDALIIAPAGLIVCNMGRESRNNEPDFNAQHLHAAGFPIAGRIEPPGTLEGGDFIWIDETHAAVGLGPRTNEEGIRQLGVLLGTGVDLHIVPLPKPDHPDDVFHLMSMISPVDKDLAVIYRQLMPETFLSWLAGQGIRFVEVPESEFLPMGCNVLALGPRSILMLDKLPETRARLDAAGCHVKTYKGDEISRKGEGGPTCLTRPLVRRG